MGDDRSGAPWAGQKKIFRYGRETGWQPCSPHRGDHPGPAFRPSSPADRPGRGTFAHAVRQSGACTDTDAAHWMACAAMDQYGWTLAAQGIRTTTRIARPGRPCVLLPYCALRRLDPLPHSWDITSDTIAAWVAGRLVAICWCSSPLTASNPEGNFSHASKDPFTTDVVDPGFVPYVLEHRIRAFILNGTDTARICQVASRGAGSRHRYWYNLLKVLKEIL